MKLAYTGWMWLGEFSEHREYLRRAFEQSVKELSHLGYPCLENMAEFIVPFFEPMEIREICAQYHMEFTGLYCNLCEGYDVLTSYVDFIREAGGRYIICMSPNWEYGRNMGDLPIDWEAIRQQAALAQRVAEYSTAHGVTFCYNPHSYTDVAGEEEFAFFAGLTDPETVKFFLDCGHATISGADPLEQLKRYYDRTAYIHIKDVDPTVPKVAPRFGRLSFVPLGFGTVNVKGYLRELQARNYQGVVCVGMPPPCPKINNYESAAISRTYLRLNCDL